MLYSKPQLFIHENVPSFPDEIVARTLSSHYDVETVLVDALDLGLPITRKRKYTVCRLRSTVSFLGL